MKHIEHIKERNVKQVTFTFLSWLLSHDKEWSSPSTVGKESFISLSNLSRDSSSDLNSSHCSSIWDNDFSVTSTKVTSFFHFRFISQDIFEMIIQLEWHTTFSNSWAFSSTSLTSSCNFSMVWEVFWKEKRYLCWHNQSLSFSVCLLVGLNLDFHVKKIKRIIFHNVKKIATL